MPIENRSPLRRTMLIPRCMTLQPILLPRSSSYGTVVRLRFLRALELIPLPYVQSHRLSYRPSARFLRALSVAVWPFLPLLPGASFPLLSARRCFDSSSSRGLFRGAHSSIGQVIFNPVARPFPASLLVSVYTPDTPFTLLYLLFFVLLLLLLLLSQRCVETFQSRRGFLARTGQPEQKLRKGIPLSCFAARGYCSCCVGRIQKPFGRVCSTRFSYLRFVLIFRSKDATRARGFRTSNRIEGNSRENSLLRPVFLVNAYARTRNVSLVFGSS